MHFHIFQDAASWASRVDYPPGILTSSSAIESPPAMAESPFAEYDRRCTPATRKWVSKIPSRRLKRYPTPSCAHNQSVDIGEPMCSIPTSLNANMRLMIEPHASPLPCTCLADGQVPETCRSGLHIIKEFHRNPSCTLGEESLKQHHQSSLFRCFENTSPFTHFWLTVHLPAEADKLKLTGRSSLKLKIEENFPSYCDRFVRGNLWKHRGDRRWDECTASAHHQRFMFLILMQYRWVLCPRRRG